MIAKFNVPLSGITEITNEETYSGRDKKTRAGKGRSTWIV